MINTEDCWLWAGAVNQKDYGTMGHRGFAYRKVYEALVGPIPDGLIIDHLCRVPRCINPAHLEPVTYSENIKRGRLPEVIRALKARITHCPQRHEYSKENTRVTKENKRQCKECSKLNMRKYRLIRKERIELFQL